MLLKAARGKMCNYDLVFLKFMRMNIADLHEYVLGDIVDLCYSVDP